jgi:hypothetical protein
MIAYTLIRWDDDLEQLWVVNVDGRNQRMVVNRIRDHLAVSHFASQYLADSLSPVGWTADNSKIILSTISSSQWLCPQSHADIGWPTICLNWEYPNPERPNFDLTQETLPQKKMWQYELSTGTFNRFPVWEGALAPNLVQIAYGTSERMLLPNEACSIFGCTTAIPPFTITIRNLHTGSSTRVLESYSSRLQTPVWSPDGGKIAFLKIPFDPSYINHYRQVPFPTIPSDPHGIYILDLATGKASLVTDIPDRQHAEVLAWLPDDRILYYYDDMLVTVRPDSTEQIVIDQKDSFIYLGVLE